MANSKTRLYVCMWDELGFEVIADCTSWERKAFLNSIAGKDLDPAPVNLHAMMMRARFNPQRNYEIWTFNTTDDIDEETLRNLADENPQGLVDMIRERGNNLYTNTKFTHTKIT